VNASLKFNAVRRLNYKRRGFRFEATDNAIGIWRNHGPELLVTFTPDEARRLRDWLALVIRGKARLDGVV
jgi:hypothetical protein